MQPEHGGRIDLALEHADEKSVRYVGELATPDGVWSTTLSVDVVSGEVALAAGDAPGWLVDFARAVVRAAWRAHGGAGFPRRLTRWRAGPGAG